MSTRIVVGDLLTGRRIMDVPHTKLSWSLSRNKAGALSCSIPMTARDVQALDLRNATTPAKTFLGVVIDDTPLEAGPIWRRSYSKADGKLDLTAAGMWSYFDHRLLIPILAASQGVIDPATGDSAAWANTDLTALSYGTIAKRLVQQAQTWTGGNVPVGFEADEVGPYERHYLGANLANLGDALRSFVDLVNGVDVRFMPRWTPDRLGMEWVLQTGTLAQPYLRSVVKHRWDYSVPEPSIRNLIEVEDASAMAAMAWATGGRQGGVALAELFSDDFLTAAGYPLLETVDSSHSDVSEESTLQDYAANATLLGRAPRSAWSFEAKADVVPRAGQYLPGDLADIVVADDPYIPAGTYTREIASISGDEAGRWVTVTTEEQVDAA